MTRDVRVVVADDAPEMLAALTDYIADEPGMTLVGAATDTASAVALAQHAPDVALLDVRMPGGGGAVATTEILRTSPKTRVLALSAHEDWALVLDMLVAGAVGYVVKGSSGVSIADAVRFAARGEAVLSRSMIATVVRELVSQVTTARRLSEELRSLDKTKREMLQILSHELLTPVAVIQGAAVILGKPGVPPETLRSVEASVVKASRRLTRLVKNISTAAELHDPRERVRTRPTPVAAVIALAAEQTSEQRKRIRASQHDGDLRVWAHEGMASRALDEVLANALELSAEEELVEIDVREIGPDLAIRVLDRGPGMSETGLTEIFEPFMQADASETRSHPGVGVGLYIASRAMQVQGGRISASNRPGGGSVFELVFRRAGASGGQDTPDA